MERSIEAVVSRAIAGAFKEYALIATDKVLPGQIRVDFHFKDSNGADVFVEILAHKIGRNALSKILNLYSALSNLESPLEKFELIVAGPDVEASASTALKGLPVRLVTFEELGVTQAELEAIKEEQRQLRARRLSPEEARLVAIWEAKKKTMIKAKDVQDAIGFSADYAYFLLHNLEHKHWLERVNTGLYQFMPAAYGYPEKIAPANTYAVGAALVEPYYFSYYTANSHYGFTTQMPFTLFIATPKKKPEVEWRSVAFKFVTLSKHKFFGYTLKRVFDSEVFMAEPEKAIVDSFDKPRYAGGIEQLARIVWRGLAKVNQEKLVDYAARMRSHALVQRLGFVIDCLSEEALVKPLSADLRGALLRHVGNSPIYLDVKKPKTGSFSKDWRIINNVSKEQLFSEIEVR